jgi:hypothetical protein
MVCHGRVVHKMEAQGGGQPQSPAIVERADEDGGPAPEVVQAGRRFTEHPIRFSVGAKHARDIYDRTHVINDDGNHAVGQLGLSLRSRASRRRMLAY